MLYCIQLKRWIKMRLLAIKRYADWRTKPKFVFVSQPYWGINNGILKSLLNKMREEKIRNVGEFIVLEIYNNFFRLYHFKEGIPKNLHEFHMEKGKVHYLRFDELKIINWAFENYLKYG